MVMFLLYTTSLFSGPSVAAWYMILILILQKINVGLSLSIGSTFHLPKIPFSSLPEPIIAENKSGLAAGRNTSPWTCFHPYSSPRSLSMSSTSSSLLYLAQSFRRVLIKIIVTNPTCKETKSCCIVLQLRILSFNVLSFHIYKI